MRDVVKCFGCVFMIIVVYGWCCVSSVVFDVVGVVICWVYDWVEGRILECELNMIVEVLKGDWVNG